MANNQNIVNVNKELFIIWLPGMEVLLDIYIRVEDMACHAALEDFNPYKALTNLHGVPCKSPHSGPATNHTCLQHTAFRYAMPMSQDIISSPFKAATRKAILTL